jgi:hypothetical protein
MSKRNFLRKTALTLVAGTGALVAGETVEAQINLNGGTFDAHSAIVDGGLNARYWNFTTNNLYGNLDRPVNQFLPFENFTTTTRFLNGGDGYGLQEPLPAAQAVQVLQQGIDFPVGNGPDTGAAGGGNIFDGTAVLTEEGILASWSGIFNAPEAGVYRFETVSDDATMIFIDGQTVINNNAQQGMTRVGADVTLTAGAHEILVTYQEGDGGNGVFAEWRAPSAPTLSVLDPALFPAVFRNREVVDNSTQAVNVTANSTIDVLASKATFGDLTLTNSTLSLTGTRLADATTFGATTATGASGINAGVDARLASLNDGGGLTTFTKSGIGSVKIDGSSTMTNATTIAINEGSLSINATGGNQSVGNANINLAGGILGIQNSDTTAATIGNAVNVTANSTISQSAGGGATITAITMQPGVTLAKRGAPGAVLTLGTTNVPGGGAITFDVRNGRLDTPAYNSGGAALTVNKTNTGTMRLPTIGTPLAAGGKFNVSAGTLQITNDAVGTSLGTTPVELNGGTLGILSVGVVTGTVEGLQEGRLDGNFNTTGAIPTGNIKLTLERAQSTDTVAHGDNTTWVYSGEINVPNNNGDGTGTIAFGENFDDGVFLRIDGVTYLNNNAWNIPTWTDPPITLSAGWHTFEARFGQGGGGVGPNNQATGNWTTALGFGIDTDKTSFSINMSEYVVPVEIADGTPELFRTPQFSSANYTSAPISVVAGNSTINVSGTASSVALGTINMQNNANLTINGATPTSVAGIAVANGTASTLTGALTAGNVVQLQNVQATGATLNIGGTVHVNGTITGGKLASATGGTAVVRPTATFAGTPTIGTASASTMRFEAGTGTINGSLVSGNQTNEGTLNFASGTTDLSNAMLVAPAGAEFEGLREGRVNGAFEENAPNPGTTVKLTLERAQSTDTVAFQNNSTWIYSGEINIPNNNGDGTGTIAFGENFDDSVLLRIGGTQYMRDTSWNTPTTSNAITLPAGWHSFEARFGQGGGGVGPNAVATGNWTTALGFGIDTDKTTFSINMSEYVAPAEPAGGGATLFRTFVEYGNVQVAAGATASLAGFRNHAVVTVDGRLNLKPDGTDAGTSTVNTLSIPGSGILDLANNDIIVRSTAAGKDAEHAAIQAEIVSAQNGVDGSFITNWNGPGLTSSTARQMNVAATFDLTAIGVIRNSDIDIATGFPGSAYTSFNGIPVTVDDILVKFTYTGDGNLDGAVTFDDYAAMDAAFFGTIPNLGWATGDINFDNVINFDDYAVVDQAFFNQGAPLSGEGGGVAAVPEPATWLMVVIGGLVGLFTWFRRRR